MYWELRPVFITRPCQRNASIFIPVPFAPANTPTPVISIRPITIRGFFRKTSIVNNIRPSGEIRCVVPLFRNAIQHDPDRIVCLSRILSVEIKRGTVFLKSCFMISVRIQSGHFKHHLIFSWIQLFQVKRDRSCVIRLSIGNFKNRYFFRIGWCRKADSANWRAILSGDAYIHVFFTFTQIAGGILDKFNIFLPSRVKQWKPECFTLRCRCSVIFHEVDQFRNLFRDLYFDCECYGSLCWNLLISDKPFQRGNAFCKVKPTVKRTDEVLRQNDHRSGLVIASAGRQPCIHGSKAPFIACDSGSRMSQCFNSFFMRLINIIDQFQATLTATEKRFRPKPRMMFLWVQILQFIINQEFRIVFCKAVGLDKSEPVKCSNAADRKLYNRFCVIRLQFINPIFQILKQFGNFFLHTVFWFVGKQTVCERQLCLDQWFAFEFQFAHGGAARIKHCSDSSVLYGYFCRNGWKCRQNQCTKDFLHIRFSYLWVILFCNINIFCSGLIERLQQ